MIEIKREDDTITRRIKEKINKEGYKNQKEFCKSLDIEESLLSDIFKNKRRTVDNMTMIAKHLGSSLDYFVGFSDEDTLNLEEKEISKYFKLSVKAIKNLKKYANVNNKEVNDFLENDDNFGVLYHYENFIKYLPTKTDLNDIRESEREKILLERINKTLILHKNTLKETKESKQILSEFIEKEMEKLWDKKEKMSFEKDYMEFVEINKMLTELNTRRIEAIIYDGGL